MRAATYARYSTDKQRCESLEDQHRECERIAERHRFKIVARFSDAGISGGTADRPGYQALLRAARAGQFAAIVAEDMSRLWRNEAEQAARLAEFEDLELIVVTRDIDTRDESAALLAPIQSFNNTKARKEVGYRSRRGREGSFLKRRPVGGRAYGYQSLSHPDGSRYVVVVPEQADVVRWIFSEYVAGSSTKRIAAALNERRVPSPGANWNRTDGKRRDGKWLASAIHGQPEKCSGILNNPRYTGRIEWARTQWKRSARDSKKRRVKYLPRPEHWYQDESLRIVSDELFAAGQRRRLSTRHKNKQQSRPGGRPPRHALSGLLICGDCGARYTIISKQSYGCATNVNGGDAACGNRKRVKRAVVEARVIEEMRERLLTPRAIAGVMKELRKVATERRSSSDGDTRTAIARRGTLEREVRNLTDAIASGGLRDSPTIANRLREAEVELRSMAAPAKRPSATVIDLLPRAEMEHRKMVATIGRELAADPDRARAAIGRLLGSITLRRTGDGLLAELSMSPAALFQLVGGELDCNAGSGGGLVALFATAAPLILRQKNEPRPCEEWPESRVQSAAAKT